MTNANDSIHNSEQGTQDGLTKREQFASMAMQGLLVNFRKHGHYGNSDHHPMVAELSVQAADELIKALNKSNDCTDNTQP